MNFCWFRPDLSWLRDSDQHVRGGSVALQFDSLRQASMRSSSQSSDGEMDTAGGCLTHTALTRADSNGDIVCGSPILPPSPSSSMGSPLPAADSEYDFYLAVAEDDLEPFGLPFAKLVEQRMNMRPCLTIRDIPPGAPRFEAMAETLERKCNGKVVFVVSRSFHTSQECQFLVHFAKTLDPYAVCQKLIPLIIDRDVQIPRELQGLSGIHYNQALRENWLWKKLWEAVHHHGGSRSSQVACSPASLFSFK